MTELARATPRIAAIVAHAPVERGVAVRPFLEALASLPLVRGVRRLIQGEDDVAFCARPEFIAGVAELARYGMSFDVCARKEQLPAVRELAARCPQVSFVLDHCAKPGIRARELEPWKGDLRALSQLPNVSCKISGLVTEAEPGSWRAADLQPYIDHAIACFGPERCMFGGDWPVVLLAASYQRWSETFLAAIAALGPEQRRQPCSGHRAAGLPPDLSAPSMPITITGATVHDVRFPTSRGLDGSDAMNPDPDYSSAYVVLSTDLPGLTGFGMTVTIGRGIELCCAAVRALSHMVVGSSLESLIAEPARFWRRLVGDSQLRWLGPEKGVIHLATAAVVNAVWDLWARWAGKPLWLLLAEMTPEQLVGCIDFRYLDGALTPAQALALLHANDAGKRERIAELRRVGYPAYTTSAGWLG